MLAIAEPGEDKFADSLRQFAQALGRPKAIVVISAHGVSGDEAVRVSVSDRNSIMHDFKGFPGKLYQIEYATPGAPDLAVRVAGLLGEEGFQAVLEAERRQDHGIWVPLRIMFPDADVPVVQITIPDPQQPRTVLKMGKALASLRKEGVLLMGSGGAVHNLEKLVWHGKMSEGEKWAQEFESWLIQKLLEKDVEAIVRFEETAPAALLAHPTNEHLLPIYFAIGAALESDVAFPIYRGIEYGSLSMLSFALAPDPKRILH